MEGADASETSLPRSLVGPVVMQATERGAIVCESRQPAGDVCGRRREGVVGVVNGHLVA
jgi:hypothetical protein